MMERTGNRTSRMLRAVVGVLLSLPLVSSAQSRASIPVADTSAEATTVKARDHLLEGAFERGDTAVIRTVLGNDMRFTHGNGLAEDKAGVMSTFGRPGTFVSRRLTASRVEMHGDAAITSGRIEIRNRAGREYTVCFMRLYLRRGADWQLVSHRTVGEGDGPTKACSPVL